MKMMNKRLARLEANQPPKPEFDDQAFWDRLMDDGILSLADLRVLAHWNDGPKTDAENAEIARIVRKIEPLEREARKIAAMDAKPPH